MIPKLDPLHCLTCEAPVPRHTHAGAETATTLDKTIGEMKDMLEEMVCAVEMHEKISDEFCAKVRAFIGRPAPI